MGAGFIISSSPKKETIGICVRFEHKILAPTSLNGVRFEHENLAPTSLNGVRFEHKILAPTSLNAGSDISSNNNVCK